MRESSLASKAAAVAMLVALGTLPQASLGAVNTDAAAAPAAPPAAPAAVSPGTQITVGDQLGIQVVGETTLSQNMTVGPDGTLSFPLLGSIKVEGQTASQAAESIR